MQVFHGQDQRPIPGAANQQVPEGLKGLFSLLLRLQLTIGFILDLQRQQLLKGRDEVPQVLVQPEDPFLQPVLDDPLRLPFFDAEEGPENVQYGQIGHRTPVVQALPFQIGVPVSRKKTPELQQQSRFADPGFPHQAHDLAFARLHLGEGLPERFDFPAAAHKPGQAPGHGRPDPRVHLRRPEEPKGLDRLLFPLDLQGFGGSERKELPGQSVGALGDQDAARLGGRLHPGGQVGGIAHGGVVHPQIIPDGAHHHGAGVEPDAHPEIDPVVSLYLLTVGDQGLLNGQGRMAGPLGVIFMGDGRPEQGHDPVAPELADRALEAVDFIHQDPAAAVHDPVDVLRVELLRDGREPGHVGEHDRHQLALPFQGTARGQDLIGQVFGGVGFGLPVVNGGEFLRFSQFVAAFKTELAVRRYILAALRTNRFDLWPHSLQNLAPSGRSL